MMDILAVLEVAGLVALCIGLAVLGTILFRRALNQVGGRPVVSFIGFGVVAYIAAALLGYRILLVATAVPAFRD